MNKKRERIVYAAYLDESAGVGNTGHYAVVAVFGDSWQFLRAQSKWEQLLRHHRLPEFKASNLKRRPEIVAEFAKIIQGAGLLACGILAEQETFREQLRGSRFHKQIQESPHILLYHHLFIKIALDLLKAKSGSSVSFVCDENARYRPIMERSYWQLLEMNKQSAPFMGSWNMDSSHTCVPLQMADLVAGELRRNTPSLLARENDFTPTMRILFDDVLWAVQHVTEQYLTSVCELAAR